MGWTLPYFLPHTQHIPCDWCSHPDSRTADKYFLNEWISFPFQLYNKIMFYSVYSTLGKSRITFRARFHSTKRSSWHWWKTYAKASSAVTETSCLINPLAHIHIYDKKSKKRRNERIWMYVHPWTYYEFFITRVPQKP